MSLDPCNIYDITVLTDLETVVNAFPRLVSYNTRYVESIEPFPSSSTSPLRSLSYSRDAFVLRDLITLSQFPRLDQLQVAFDQKVLNCSLPSEVVLPQLKNLALQAEPFNIYQSEVWPRSLPVIVQRCPNLTQLEITDPLRAFFVKALPDLAPLLPQLTALKLDVSDSFQEFCGIVCDRYLPLLPNLRHLDLADNTVGSLLPRYLRQLPHLSSLRLGRNVHYDGPTSQDILSLVCGTSKLVKLEKLVLDCVEGRMGKRWDISEMEASIAEADFNRLRDWSKPGFDEQFEAEDIRQITFPGQQNGIEISGSAVVAVSIWDAYHLESANRRVMKAFKTKSLDGLKEFGRSRIPPMSDDRFRQIGFKQPQARQDRIAGGGLVRFEFGMRRWES